MMVMAADTPLPKGFSAELSVGRFARYNATGSIQITLAGNHLSMPMDIEAEIRVAIVGEEEIDKKAYWWQESDVQLKAKSEELGTATRTARVKWLVPRDDLLAGKRMRLDPGGLQPKKILMSLDGDPTLEISVDDFDSFERENPYFFLLNSINLSSLKFVKREPLKTKAGAYDTYRYYVDQRYEYYKDDSRNAAASGSIAGSSVSKPVKETPQYSLAIDGDLWVSDDVPFAVTSSNLDLHSSIAVGKDLSGGDRSIRIASRVQLDLLETGDNATTWIEEIHEPPKS
ncbi:MAG: hypothetical protein ACREJQ_04065 [bacterium]